MADHETQHETQHLDATRRAYVQIPLAEGQGLGKVHHILYALPWHLSTKKALPEHAEVTTYCGMVFIIGRFGDVDQACTGPATCGRCGYLAERRAMREARE